MSVLIGNATGWERGELLDLPASELIETLALVQECHLIRTGF